MQAPPPPTAANRPRPIVLLFAGQGAQQDRMGAGLYEVEPVFTAAADRVFARLEAHGHPLHRTWLGTGGGSGDPIVAQPLLFALGYALGHLVIGWGVQPVALLGHSVGELAAAAVAGVFSLEDAVRLVIDRSLRAQRTEPGGMLAVAADPADIQALLPAGTVVGAVNAPRNTVVAGSSASLAAAADTLRGAGYACMPVRSSRAFHSPTMVPVVAGTMTLLATVTLRPPSVSLISSCTASQLTAAQATDRAFWAAQPAAMVRFWPALDALLARGRYLLVDAGPGGGLATLARRHPAVASGASAALAVLPKRSGRAAEDLRTACAAAEQLRTEGHPVVANE